MKIVTILFSLFIALLTFSSYVEEKVEVRTPEPVVEKKIIIEPVPIVEEVEVVHPHHHHHYEVEEKVEIK